MRATEHVWVLPHWQLNTNLGALAHQKHQRRHKVVRMLAMARAPGSDPDPGSGSGPGPGSGTGSGTGTGIGGRRAEFVFHAVGCAPKVAALREAIAASREPMAHGGAQPDGHGPSDGGRHGDQPTPPDTQPDTQPVPQTHPQPQPQHPADNGSVISDRRLSMIIPKLVLAAAVDDATFAELAAAYPHEAAGFRFLNLELNRLTAASATPLGRIVRSNPALETLRLGGNALGDEGAAALAEALLGNRTLRCLEMSRNGLTQRGLATLLEALQHNSTLVDLDLSGNGLGGCPACHDLVVRHLLAARVQSSPTPCLVLGKPPPAVQWVPAATLRDRHARKAGVAGTPRVVYI